MATGSSIIYIGSTLSEHAVKNAASYTISKHATVGMMRASCQDLADTGIHTACICPGFTNTQMIRNHLDNDEKLLTTVAIILSSGNDFISVINGSIIHANLGQIGF